MPTLKKYHWLRILLLFVISLTVSLYNRQSPLDMTYMRWDTSVYQYIGWQMWEGQIPYRDIFDHKGPIIYLWNMLGYGLHPMLGQWFLELIALFTSTLIAAKIGSRFISEPLSILLIGITFFNIPINNTVGNLENIAVLISWVLLYLFIEYLFENKLSKTKIMVFGASTAFCLFLKPIYLATPAVLIMVILIKHLLKKQYQKLYTDILYFSFAFLSITAAVIGWLYYHHALQNFWDCYVTFNLEYTKYWQRSNSRTITLQTELNNNFIKITMAIALYLLARLKHYTSKEKTLIITLIIAVPVNLIGVILPNNPFLHYLYILYPLTLILAMLAVKPWQKKLFLTIVLSICFIASGINCARNIRAPVSDKNARAAATMINTLLKEDETFQTLGWDMARLHLLSQKRAATPYVLTGMHERIYQRYLYTYIKKTRPKMVVILTYPETAYYHQLLKAYWKNFYKDYDLYSTRFGYEIYILKEKTPPL